MANSTSARTTDSGTGDTKKSTTVGEVNSTGQWQRLSPIALVYFGASIIQGIIGQFVYIAPAILVSYNSIKNNPWIGFPVAMVVLTLISISAILKFYFFQFRLSQNSIEIRSGVLSKKHVNLPFSRIQNVKIEQPIYYRATGFACLTLDTAGSSKQEAKVVALPLTFAETLKQEIMVFHHDSNQSLNDDDLQASENSGIDEHLAHEEKVINTRSIKDLVIHGVTSNRIWIFLGALAPFYEKLGRYISEFLQGFSIDFSKIFDPSVYSMWQLSLYALSLTMLVMLVMTLFSIFGAIMTFYGYTLSKVDDRYIRRSGLFTKHEVSMRLSRLQNIAYKRDWLDMLLNRVNLRFEQSNSQMKNIEGGGISSLTDKIIVPSVTESEALELICDVYPNQRLANIAFTAISKRFLIRYLGYTCMPIFFCAMALLVVQEKFALLLPVIGAFSFISVLIFMRWKRWGYAIDNHYLYVRKGFFGVDYFIFPIYKIQQSQFKQSQFMKRHQLCTIRLILASGAMDIPFIKETQGVELIDLSLFQVETSGKSWM